MKEEVDPVTGINNEEYARLNKNEEIEEDAKQPEEIAIIGFWKLKEDGVFRCIHSFEVPNPMKREVVDVQGTNLYEVLFRGDDGKEIFFMFDAEKDEDLKLGILHLCDQEKKKTNARLNSDKDEMHTVQWNCTRVIDIKNGSILEKFIHDLNGKDLAE